MNPEKVEIDKYVMVSLAERNNKWYYGYIYNYSLSFGSYPCMETLGYNSRIEALKSVLNVLISKIDKLRDINQRHEYYLTDVKRMNYSLSKLKVYLYNISHVQLSLFD